jgi:hypothetical protein
VHLTANLLCNPEVNLKLNLNLKLKSNYKMAAEFENAEALEAHMPDIGELLDAARKPKRDRLGGVDAYLARILCRKEPQDITSAIGRLSLGVIHNMPVRLIAMV